MGRGPRTISRVCRYVHSCLIYWTSAHSYEYHYAEIEGSRVSFYELLGSRYPCVRFIQFLLKPKEQYPVESTTNSLSAPTAPAPAVQVDIGTPRLSTIPEERASDVSSVSDLALYSMFGDIAPEAVEPLKIAAAALLEPEDTEPMIDIEVDYTNIAFWQVEMNQCDHEEYPCIQLYVEDIMTSNYHGIDVP